MGFDAIKFAGRTRYGKWMDGQGEADLASIIIPSYNRAGLLDEAIGSAAGQTYRPVEIIVVDDGSTDHTREVAQRWRERLDGVWSASVRYFHQANGGVSAARNRGLIESRGEYIQFLDSDDILNCQKLGLQIECLRRHPECGYVVSDRMRLDNSRNWGEISHGDEEVVDSAQWYCSGRVMMTMAGLYRRQACFEAGPYCEDMRLGEDEEFTLRVLLATPKAAYLPGVLCAVRHHPGPRLTDDHKGKSGLAAAVFKYRRMVESAAHEDRLNNLPLVLALAKSLSHVIVTALELGCGGLAEEAIGICRSLPISAGRRRKLAIYEAINSLPEGVLPRLWPVWQKVRQMVLEIPGGVLGRVRGGSKTGRKSA